MAHALSYAHGIGYTPLLGDTIGGNLRRTALRHGDREAHRSERLRVAIETGPHKHNIGQTFFLYCFEPGGNRFEIGAGGYLIFDPDWKPIVWTQAERAKGQAWGLKTTERLTAESYAQQASQEQLQEGRPS